MLYNWASRAGNSIKVSRIAGIYPVCDLLSYPGLSRAASAYGMIPDTFLSHIKKLNPVDRLISLYEADVRIFHIHGDSDAVVPLAQNSQVIYDRYKALGGDITLIVVHGKGHEEIPKYFQSEEMLDFLLENYLQWVKNDFSVVVVKIVLSVKVSLFNTFRVEVSVLKSSPAIQLPHI